MEEKKPFATRMEEFFAGKGFYIVLFLCLAVIGLAAWSLLTGNESTGGSELSMPVSGMETDLIGDAPVGGTLRPTPTPAATATPKPVPTAAPQTAIPEAPVPTAAPAAPSDAQLQDYFIWPVGGPVEIPYSMDALRFSTTMQDWRTHDGIDIAAELGTQVKATANGRVAEIRDDDLYGTTVILSHRDGLVSVYSNLAAMPTVKEGDPVSVGQVIGAVGDTALVEAGEVCHLHFAMMLDGESVDPMEYMP